MLPNFINMHPILTRPAPLESYGAQLSNGAGLVKIECISTKLGVIIVKALNAPSLNRQREVRDNPETPNHGTSKYPCAAAHGAPNLQGGRH